MIRRASGRIRAAGLEEARTGRHPPSRVATGAGRDDRPADGSKRAAAEPVSISGSLRLPADGLRRTADDSG